MLIDIQVTGEPSSRLYKPSLCAVFWQPKLTRILVDMAAPDRASTDVVSNNIETELSFFSGGPPDGERAYVYYFGHPTGGRTRNFDYQNVKTVVHDVRGKESSFLLDKSGFKFMNHVSEEKEFLDAEMIKTRYYKEIEEILREETGASRIVIFDHTVRYAPFISVIFAYLICWRRRNYDINVSDEVKKRPSVSYPNIFREYLLNSLQFRVHVDQTAESAAMRVRRHVGKDAESLLQRRYQIINVWRPIKNPVAHYPLAVLDFSTIDCQKDLVDVELIRPDQAGAFHLVRHNPSHRWHFLDKQTPDEVVLIKNFDSDPTKAALAPHAAMKQVCDPGLPLRQSIEVRAIVFE